MFLYHSPCLPQNQGLMIPRAADGLKKRCKELPDKLIAANVRIPLLERHQALEKRCWGRGSICEAWRCSSFLSWENSSLGSRGTTETFWGAGVQQRIALQTDRGEKTHEASSVEMEIRPLVPFTSKYRTPGISS